MCGGTTPRSPWHPPSTFFERGGGPFILCGMCVSGWDDVRSFGTWVGDGVVKDVVTVWSNARNPYTPGELIRSGNAWSTLMHIIHAHLEGFLFRLCLQPSGHVRCCGTPYRWPCTCRRDRRVASIIITPVTDTRSKMFEPLFRKKMYMNR